MEEMTDSVSDSPLKVLHKTMITAGYGDVPKDYNSFERTLTQQGEAGTKVRLQLHKRLVRDKLLTDVPEDYNTFASTLFKPVSKPQPQATAQSTTQSAAPTEEQPSHPVQSQQQSASAEEQPSPSQYTTQMATDNPTVGYRRATVGQRNADAMPSRLGVSLEDDRPTMSAEQAPQSVQLPGRDRLWELAQKQADLGDRRSLATRVKDMASKGQLFTSSDPFSVTPSFNDAPMTAMGKVEAIRQARQRMAAQKRMSDPDGLDKLVNATVDEAVQRAEKQSQDYDRAFGIAPTSAVAASEIAKGAHRQAVLESETDVNKLTEQVLDKMQPDIEVMRDTMLADGKTTDEVMTALNTYIGETVPNAVLNALRKRNAPKSTLDYVLGTAYNSWLSTALTNTIARNMRGGEQSYSLGGLSAAAELEEYGKSLEATKGKVASMAYGALGGGLGMITDPSNALSMMVGAGVFNAAKPILTKSASGLIARSTVTKGTQKATQQALMHILPNTKAYQTAMKIGQSGASFAGFEVNSQLKADLNSGTFGGMDYAKAVGRGLVLGGATAGFGQVVDYGFKALGKGTKALSTKIGASEKAANIMAGTEQIAGKVVVAPVVEAGVFTGGSMLLEDKPLGEYSASEIGDLYGSNLAFIIAMKGLNLPKTIVNSAIGPDAVPFFESVRHDIANPGKALERIGANIDNIGDNALTDSEWREVNEVLGYDIRTLKGAVKAATEQNYQGKYIVNLYKGLSDVMTSDALTLQQKAVVSRMFGQQMKAMPVLGVKMEKDNDSGTYVVTALDPTGTAIRRLKYTKEQDAESSYNVLVKAANVNHMDILEASVANGYKSDGSDADPELPKKLWLKACAEAGYDGKLTARQLEAQGDPTTAGQGGRALSKYKFMLAEMVSRKKHTSDADAVVETYDGKTHQVVETVADEDGQHYICLDDDGKHIDIHESNVRNVASTPKAEEVLAADEASVLDGEVFGFSNEQTIEQLAQGQEAPMSYRECAYLAIKEAKGTLTPEEAERCKAYTREQLDYYRSKYGYETEAEQRARIDEEAAKRGEQATEAPTAEEAPTEEEVKPTEEAPVKAETPTISQESEQVSEQASDQVSDQHKPLPSEVAEPKERAKALLDEVNGDKESAKEVADKAIARAKKRLDELDKAESVDEATDIANAKERQALKTEIDKWEQTKAEFDAPTPEVAPEEAEPAPADGMVDELDALQAEVRNRQIATRIPSEVNEALQKLRVDVFGMADDENVNGLSSDGKIYVNVDRKSGKREVWIVGHEIGHIMDSRNPEAYSIVRKRANDWLRANVGEIGYAARVENVMSKYRQHIEDVLFDKYSASMSESAARARAVQESMDMVTREYIETEIANDILGDLIQNPETAKKMFKDAPSTASAKFYQAVRDFFRNLKERLYGTLGKRPERNINRVIRAFNDMYQKEVAKVMEDAEAAEATSMAESDAPRYSILTEDNAKDDHERSVLKEFAEDKVVHVTRSMQEVLIDGVRYALPPMAAKVNGEYQTALRINDDGTLEPTVLKSDEFPDKVNDKGQFILDKGNGKRVPAAYNPYFHAAGMNNMMNDQFSEAQDRDNLITVEGVIPLSELTSGYKADKAKDSVGLIPWKSGVIQGQLEGTRDVYLSRYFKGLRVIPDEEVAENIYGKINGKIEAMPSNVVTKNVRRELEKLGVKFVETDNQGKLVGGPHEGDYYTWWYGPESASARWDGYRKQANNEGMSLEDWVKSTGREGNIQYYSTEEKKNATVASKTADKLGVKARTVREHEMSEAERTGRKAWVDEQTGEVVVDLDRVGDSKDVKSAVAHALADGKSLGEMFKGEALQSIYDAIGKGTDGKTAIAKLAVNNESGKAAKDWKKAVASARIAIKKATGIEFDNTDIEQLLYKEAQGKQGNPVVKAKQIAASEDYKANHLFDGVARVPEDMVTSERVPRFSISTEGEGTTSSAAGDLDALRRRIRKSTKDELKANAEIVRAYLKDRLSPAMATRFGKRKILKIANEIERATTLSKRSLQNAIDEAEMTIGDSEVKTALDAMMTVLNTPTMRVNSRKQQVANKVDADTVTFFADIKGILKDVRKNNLSEKEIEIRDMIKENEAEAERIQKEADDQGRELTATELDNLASIAEENKQLEKERTAAREERRTIEEILRGDDIQTATERLLQLQNNPNRTAAENRELAALPFRIRLTALQSKLLQYQNKKTLPDDSEAEARLQALKDLGNYDDVVEQYLNYMQATPRARRAARIQQQRELMYEIADITRQLNDILENGHEVYQRWVQNIANHDSALLTSAVAAVSNPKKAPLQPSQQTAAMEQARGQKYSVVKSFFHGFYDTFNHMTQMIEASALPKEGFMYNYFITDPNHGWNALQGRYKDMLYEYRKLVTDTMEQMIGKDEMNRYNDTKRITLTLRDSEGNVLNQFEREYTIGQLLYEYLLSRMAKGKTRLEMMGFDETAQLEVEKALGSRYMDFGDWVSEELLNDLYQEQNKTYKRLNGINLGRVEHYFPFRYTREEISQPGNLVEEYVQSLTSGISSEKHRTDNNHAFDLTRDAMSLLDKTIENGCRQATFGEFNRDLSVLLSSAEFMNALKNRGHDLDKRWTEVCNIAAGIDKSVKDAELQNYINRMLSGSVIAFRINTALKQLLSAPAFMLEHGLDPQWQLDLAKATIRQLALGTDSQTVKWCMDNLPMFRARWNDQNMGDIRMIDETLGTVSSKLRRGGKFNPSAIGQKVMDTSSKVTAAGMIPNRAIDMFTCAIGAKAQYDYSLRKYRNAIGAQLDILKANTPEENWNEAEARKSLDKWAHNKALMEAEQIYNESQQSSQGAYVSPLQRLGTNWARILTLFKTASLSYARKGIEGLVTSSRAARGLGAVEPIFIPGIGEQDQPFVMAGRGKYKGVRRATKAMEGLAQASMFLIGLGMAWNLGGLFTAGYAPVSAEEYINNITDDEANVTMTAALLSNSPLAESLIAAAGGQSKAQMSDALIIDYARKFKDATAAEGIKLGLQVAAQVGLGIKTDTWTNMLTGIDGMISDGTIDYTDIQFILNSPPSQGIYRTARAMEGERLKNGEIGMSQYISKMLFAKACNDVGEQGNWWDSRKDYKDSDIDKVLDAYRKRMYPALAEYKAPADKDADIEEEKGKIEVYDTALKVMNTVRKAYVSRDPNAKEIADNAHALLMQLMDGSKEQAAHEDKLQQYRKAYLESLEVKREQGDAAYEEYMGANGVAVDKGNEYRALKAEITSALNSMFRGDISQDEAVGIIKDVREEIKNIE